MLIKTSRKCISSSTVFRWKWLYSYWNQTPFVIIWPTHLSYCPHKSLDSINLNIFVCIFSCLCCWTTLILVWNFGSSSGSITLEYGSMLLCVFFMYNYCYLCCCYVDSSGTSLLLCEHFAVAPLVLRTQLLEVPNRTHPFHCIGNSGYCSPFGISRYNPQS